jgi:putative peptidoglycan lipid II flippase
MSAKDGLNIGRFAIGASALLGGALLAGRISGFFREVHLAAVFGVSAKADMAVLLLTLPDLMINLLMSGGLSAALIPRLRLLSSPAAQTLSRQMLFLTLFFFSLLALTLIAFPSAWFSLLAPGIGVANLPSIIAIVTTAIAIPLAAASGVTSASLNSQQRFLVAGCGTLIFNVVVIVALTYGQYGQYDALIALGSGIGLGAALRLLSQLIVMPQGWLFGPVTLSALDSIFIRGFIATAGASCLMLLAPVVVRAFASTLSSGSIAALNYATKLVELPVGVLIISISSVALAQLSAHHAANDCMAVKQTLHESLKRALCNAVGSGILIAYFAEPLIELAFGRGAMDSAAISRVVRITHLLLIGLPFIAMSSIAIAQLNAKEQSWIVLKITLGCLCILPVLVLPGLLIESEALLIFAIVGFQVIHAIWLLIGCGLLSKKSIDWVDKGLIFSFSAIACAVSIIIVIDFILTPFFANQEFLRGVFSCISIAIVVLLPQQFLGDKNSI